MQSQLVNRQLTGRYYYKVSFWGLRKVLMVEYRACYECPIFFTRSPYFLAWGKATELDKLRLKIK